MDIIWADMLMDVSSVMFGQVITQVFLSGLIMKFKVFLSFAVKEPEVSHFHGTRSLSFDGFVDNSDSSGVVDMNGCWWLGMTKFSQSKTKDLGLLCIQKEGT